MTDPAAPDLAIVELNALADRCEAATGREEFAFFFNLEREIKAALEGREYISFEDDLANHRGATPPRYTASLDAAMTLVPEGGPFILTNADLDGVTGDYTRWRCALADGGDLPTACATPALALCAASLRDLAKVRGR